jgi:hypothetical protein
MKQIRLAFEKLKVFMALNMCEYALRTEAKGTAVQVRLP